MRSASRPHRWATAFAALLGVACLTGAASAQTTTQGKAGAAANAHGTSFRAKPGKVATRLDARFRTPEVAIRYGGYLTTRSAASPEAIARAYLRDHAAQYRLTPADIAGLVLLKQYRTKHNGSTSVFLASVDRGRPVYGSELGFLIDRHGRIVTVTGRLAADAEAAGSPSLDASGAILTAARKAGVRHTSWLKPLRQVQWNHARFANTLARGVRRPSALTADLVTYPVAAGQPARLAWKTVTELSGQGWYESLVDAQTGELLYRRNLYAHAQGRVFTAQHPGVTGATRTVVPFPAGWNNASAATSGPLTNAYQDLTNSNTVEYQTTTPASPDPNFQNYDFPFTDLWNVNATSASLTPAGPTGYADIDAVITQLFYYTNTMHDYLLGFGFDGPSGNFEGADPVLAEATDGWEDGVAANCPDDSDPDPDPELCRNNANFATPGDGTSPRMQMYMFTSPWRDGSLDGDVIAHEYGHGLSNRLVGGGSLGSGVQTGAMGEGWGDFLSLSKWDDTIVGEYVTGNATTGIRNFAYDNSPLEYSDLCNVGSGCEVHNDGEIWAVTLFDMRAALIARYGNPGKDEAMQLVVDGMKATGSSPDYLDSRDGILAADLAGNSGDNQCLIWGAFAGREMGFSASTSGTNDMSPTTATDGPSSCTPTADIGGPYNTIEGTDAALDASASLNPGDPTTGPLTYAWDLDNDGAFDDATGQSPAFQLVGQDGVYPIGLRVTNEYGFTDTDSTTVTVANVAPTVTIADNGPKAENTAVTVSGVVSDAGWLEDPLTATIDWGDGSGPVALTGVVEKVRPLETITYSEQHTYGDDGLFTVEVCAADDDTTDNCNSTVVTVTNVDPTAVITTPTISINGVDTIIAHEGQLVPFSADSFDPGSDDRTTTWNWDDGPPAPDSTKVSLNDTVPPLLPDPDPSPEINPRTVTDSEPHAFGDACFYQVVFGASDDDLGTASDTVAVIIAGNESKTKSSGYWQTQYRPRPTALPEARRLCYLEIVGFMSTVFDEARDASTVAHAFDVLSLAGNGGSEQQKLDRELLTAWLNFANGGIEYGQLFDGVPFSTVLATAEAVRLNPASTEAQLKEQRQILQHLNG